jgi:hypothetical protein
MLPGREPEPPRWEASDQPLELRHGILEVRNSVDRIWKLKSFLFGTICTLIFAAILSCTGTECSIGRVWELLQDLEAWNLVTWCGKNLEAGNAIQTGFGNMNAGKMWKI